MIYEIQKIHHFTLISRGYAWLSMKRGGCKFGGSKTGAALCPKNGAVVSQLVLKLKESVPPPPGGHASCSTLGDFDVWYLLSACNVHVEICK